MGNQAAQRLLRDGVIQAKLTVNQPGDRFEQEADRVADQVMKMSEPGISPAAVSTNRGTVGSLQRKCACGGSTSLTGECADCRKDKLLETNGARLQRKLTIGASNEPLEQEADRVADQVLAAPSNPAVRGASLHIQRFTGQPSAAADTVPASVDHVLASPGRSLDPALQQDMEQRFGHDFSRVRIHTGSSAEQSARDVDAHAYTVGQSIVFDTGRYSSGTSEGRRLLAHELTHVVQQSGAQALRTTSGAATHEKIVTPSPVGGRVIQREVSPYRVSKKEDVLDKIQTIVDANGKGKGPAEANLVRLAMLGLGFNPGATKEEKNNAFVYTCHCGWIDMGHFFISAAAAYAVGYQRRRLLLETVPDVDGRQVLSDVRKLVKSGEPRDIGLVFGYWMEFLQQVAKLVSDPGRKLPARLKTQLKEVLAEYERLFQSVLSEDIKGTLEGSARSAFTMEDLPSDCYGAAIGQDVWKQSDGAKRDLPQIHGLVKDFFKKCGAVHVERDSPVYCAMMAETTPGFRCEKDKDDKYKHLGEPARHGSTKPRLLNTAEPLCGKSPAVEPCRSGTGHASSPLPTTVVDVSGKGVTGTYTEDVGPEDVGLPEPRQKGYFGGDVPIPGRPERFDIKEPPVLKGPSFVRVTPRGNVVAYSTLGGVPGLGDVEGAAHLDPGLGRYGAGGNLGFRTGFDLITTGPLQLYVHGKLDIDLENLLKGIAGPELEELKAVLTSDEFTKLAKQALTGDLKPKQFAREVKALLRKKFPQGPKLVIDTVIGRLKQMDALALASRLEASGSVSIGGVPISGFIFHKSFGMRPLLGLEAGVVLSELVKGRTILGAKGLLYGQDFAQAQLVTGFDPIAGKGMANLHIESKMVPKFVGKKLSLDVNYAIDTQGQQEFVVMAGLSFKFEAGGSKPRGAK
jgi:hypothetical protein